MGAETPVRRNRTAREMAEQTGASTRTIRRIIAEPRGDFLARARERRNRAVHLRDQGLLYREIAEAMGTTKGDVGRLLHDARQLEQRAEAEQLAADAGRTLSTSRLPA